MLAIFNLCFFANFKRSSSLAILPSSFITSQITELGFILANFDMSTDASVCPALSRTPPLRATSGKTCPGDTISFFFTFLLIATLIVFALSKAEIPVVIPFLASIETVNAVCILALLTADINGRESLSTCLLFKAKQINPLPCFAIKLIILEFALEAGITRSPSFSLLLLSTKIKIFPRFASSMIVFIDESKIFFIFSFLN